MASFGRCGAFVLLVAISAPVAAEAPTRQKPKSTNNSRGPLPPEEDAGLNGTPETIPIADIAVFDRAKGGWACVLAGFNGHKVEPNGRADPVMRAVTMRLGEKADIWIAGGKLSLKTQAIPDDHVIVSTDADIVVGTMQWGGAVRGTSTVTLDTRTGILHLSRLMMWVKERKMLGQVAIYVCR
jgi:hypothetical protein